MPENYIQVRACLQIPITATYDAIWPGKISKCESWATLLLLHYPACADFNHFEKQIQSVCAKRVRECAGLLSWDVREKG